MSKRNSASSDDIIASMLDPKVLTAVANALAPIIAQSLEANLTKRIEELTVTVKVLKDNNDILTKKQTALEQEVSDLRKQALETERRIEDVDIYSRAHDIIIRGLPDTSYAQRAHTTSSSASDNAESSGVLEDTVIELCQKSLGVAVQRQDISVAHRLKASAHDQFRPVIVRFTSRRMRDDVYRAKRELKTLPRDKAIYISEHLTRLASSVFFEARKLLRDKKLTAAWTMHGLVNVKYTSNVAEKPTIIRNVAELATLAVRT
jgi:hypothetical protein